MSITQTMRNIEYLFRKYDHLMAKSDMRVVFDKPTRGREYKSPMSAEEHDRIYRLVTEKPDFDTVWGPKLGWSPHIIGHIRRKRHPRYDAIRSEAWRKEAK